MRSVGRWHRAEHAVLIAILLVLSGCGSGKRSDRELSSLLRSGQELVRKGRYQEAIATFEKAISIDPGASEAYLRLALIYEECVHDPAAALRYYRMYQNVEKDAVRREEVQGWMLQLEQAAAKSSEGGKEGMSSQRDTGFGEGSPLASGEGIRSGAGDFAGSVKAVEQSGSGDVHSRRAAVPQEIRDPKGQKGSESSLLKKLADAEGRVKQLEGEKESLGRSLEESRNDVLESQQTARQLEQRTDSLQKSYESQIADLKKRLDNAETRIRELDTRAQDKQITQLTKELRDAKAQRDAAQVEKTKAAAEIVQLKKSVNAYAATLSSLQKANDELRQENASLRSRLTGRAASVRRHTVRAGETLKIIAGYQSVYGDSGKWVLIYRANKDKIRDPNKLTPGQVLVIPPG